MWLKIICKINEVCKLLNIKNALLYIIPFLIYGPLVLSVRCYQHHSPQEMFSLAFRHRTIRLGIQWQTNTHEYYQCRNWLHRMALFILNINLTFYWHCLPNYLNHCKSVFEKKLPQKFLSPQKVLPGEIAPHCSPP